ncbi:MAG: ferritin-like domain-containing protein [Oscillospiraceae bacterium]|nr:ferritin-like domain-containing protein [Oscillospiraceae bacterium]
MQEDYRAYDKIWQRVSPELNPYPEVRAEQAAHASDSTLVTLPAAAGDPCCMGEAAQSELEVLQGFLREEIADARIYRMLARCVSNAEARRVFRKIAESEAGHARRLQAANYLIAGECYRVSVCFAPQRVKDYCATLRERYHAEVCDGFNFQRAAEETTDFCLKRLFGDLSTDEYRHADWLRRLLEKAL